MGVLFANARKMNSKDLKTRELLDEVLNNPNLTDHHVKNIFKKK
jgi:hypothetical protein